MHRRNAAKRLLTLMVCVAMCSPMAVADGIATSTSSWLGHSYHLRPPRGMSRESIRKRVEKYELTPSVRIVDATSLAAMNPDETVMLVTDGMIVRRPFSELPVHPDRYYLIGIRNTGNRTCVIYKMAVILKSGPLKGLTVRLADGKFAPTPLKFIAELPASINVEVGDVDFEVAALTLK